jgi:hypothetical protein
MFKMPLAKRLNRAEWKRNRYRTDPDYRLSAINRARVAQGFDALGSLEDSAKLRIEVGA